MSVDRAFLDIFWELSVEDADKRLHAVDKLIKALGDKTDDVKSTYFTYARQRLVKGLRSFEESSRAGFESGLIRLLKDFPSETSTDILLQSMRVQVYCSEPSTKNERSSVKSAHLACARVLCATKRIREIDDEFVNLMLPPVLSLTKSTHHRDTACLAISELSLQAPKHIFGTSLDKFLKEIWHDMMSTNSEFTGSFLLVVLSFQHRFQKRLQKLGIPLLDFSERKYLRKLQFGTLHSRDDIVMRLIDEVVRLNALTTVWASLKESLCSKVNNAKHTFRFLQIVVHIICNLDASSAELILSKEVLEGFSKQLSDPKYKYFPQVSHLLKIMMNKVVGSINMNDEIANDSSVSKPPNWLLRLIASNFPLFDLYCDTSCTKPCQIILDSAPLSVTLDTLQLYVRQLMDAFTNSEVQDLNHKPDEEDTEQFQSVDSRSDGVRVFVIKYLQMVMNAIIKSKHMGSSKFLDEILEFLLTIGLTSTLKIGKFNLKTHVSANVAKCSWAALFGTLDYLILQTVSSNKLSDVQTSKNLSNLDVIKHFTTLIRNGITLCSKFTNTDSPDARIDLCLGSLKRCLKLLQKADSQDQLDQFILILCGACSIFSLSMPLEDTVGLLDDLVECRKRRLSNVVEEGDPHWSEVLTDVILSAISYPVRMLRSASRLTFKKMVTEKVFLTTNVSGGEYPSCLKLIGDILKTRPTKQTNSTKHDDDSGESETEDLIQFSITHSNNVVQSKQEMLVQNGDSEEVNDGEEFDQKTNSDDSSDDSDSDALEEEIDIDENELNQIKNSVRAALGPAALDCEDNDSNNNDCKDFTDAEMFARNEALAAAFRVHMRTPQRIVADQARTLGQLKMRCFDLIECILQYCSEPQLLLHTLQLVIDIGKGSIEYEMAKSRSVSGSDKLIVNQKEKRKTRFIAHYGDVPPLSRIVHTVKKCHFRSQRTQSEFIESLKSTDQQAHLQKIMKSFVDDTKMMNAPSQYIELLSNIVEFIYRSITPLKTDYPDLESTVSEYLLERLHEVLCKHNAQPTLFFNLINHCQFFQENIVKLLEKFPSTQKCIRFSARRFLNLLRENGRKFGLLSLSESREEKLHLKRELKRQRQQKRREKALMKQNLKNNITESVPNEKSKPKQKNKKTSRQNGLNNKPKHNVKTPPLPKSSTKKILIGKRKRQPVVKDDNKRRKILVE
ncbi:unnamed protein product [Heterobilharzia americana]|nr:unnamed protein product [Heterobilharzia americana]